MPTADVPATKDQPLADAIRDQPQRHPALARLRADLVKGVTAEQVITSYDRQHHRHNRS
jgi:hypothetical protein